MITYSCWGKNADVCEEGADVLWARVVNCDVGHISLGVAFEILVQHVENIALLKREPLDEFEGLSKNVEWLIVCFGTESDGEGADLVDDASVLEDCLGTHKHAVNL